MDAQPGLVVDSVTGVDVALPVAGPGARSFAFVIDWHIRTILSVAWYVVAAIQHNGAWSIAAPLSPDSAWFVYVIAPPAAIYFLYHPVWEVVTRGRTPGKRMAGVQIVSRDGGAPGVGSLLTRNVFRLVDSFPIAYAVGLVATMLTKNHVRIGDLAAGTLLVYVHHETYVHPDTPLPEYIGERAAGPGPSPGLGLGLGLRPSPGLASGFGPGPGPQHLDPATAEVVSELLRRWDSLASDARDRIARKLLMDSAADDDATLRTRLQALTTESPAAARGGTP